MAKSSSKQQKKKVETSFIISPELKELAETIIDKEQLDVAPAKVEFLFVYPYISKTTVGLCKPAKKELKYYSKCDYLIEMSGDVWDNLDDPTRYILMHHELMHINTYMDDNGNQQFKTKVHDVQDFSKLISKHGVDWIKKVKLTVSSINDLSPEQEDDIRI